MLMYEFFESLSALSQSEEISSDFCCFYGGGIRHNEDIMHSFQNFIVRLIPNHPPPLETRICKLVVRALVPVDITSSLHSSVRSDYERCLSKPRYFLSLSVASSQLKLACLALVRLVVFTLRYTQ